MAKKGNATIAALAGQLTAGISKRLANVGSLTLAGGTFTPAQLTTLLGKVVQLRQDVDDARSATKAKVAAETAQLPALRTTMSAFVQYLRATFGDQADVLADFGLQPKKAATPPTIEEKAAAAAKREATRVARHTMGPVQKKKVKGAVTGVVVTPITAPQPIAPVSATPTAPIPGATTGGGTTHTA